MTPLTPAEITALADWSTPKEVPTRRGPRLLLKAKPTPAFLSAWAADEPGLRAAGVSYGYSRYISGYEVTWWQPVPESEIAARAESVTASRAVAAQADLPAPAGLTYRPFQQAAILYGLSRPSGNVLFADEMGLGKTIEVIGLINSDPSIQRVIIVCPKTLKRNWYNELTKWLVRPALIAIADDVWPAGAEIVIVNYDRAKKYHAQLMAFDADALVLDEAHLVKNSKAQRSQYILGRPETRKKEKGGGVKVTEAIPAVPARRHLRVTGTPIVNRPAELYNLIKDLHPKWAAMGFFGFAKRYAAAYHNGFGWDFTGADHLDELQRLLRETCMVRRLKAEVLTELPAKVRQVIELEPETAEQRRAVTAEAQAQAAAAERRAALQAAAEAAKGAGNETEYRAAVKALAAGEQADFEEMSRLRHETALAKLPLAVDHILAQVEDDPDKKVIVAAHHHDVIDGLMAAFAGAGLQPVRLTGDDSEAQRHQAVTRFQTDPACRVFVASIQAAGVGITLTAASLVEFVEEDWVPGNVSQMEDRAHRIGQTDTVFVQHLVMTGSPDVRMIQVNIQKQEVIDQALDSRPAPAVTAPERANVYERAAVTAEAQAQTAANKYAASTGRPAPFAEPAEPKPAVPALTDDQVAAVHQGLRLLAGLDADDARELNGQGFSKTDTAFGKSLAGAARLSRGQAAAGLRLIKKYRRQMPAGLLARASGEPAD